MKEDILLKKFEGAMLGCALGDAIGELAFRYRSREKLEKHISTTKLLVYTDDTAMALGLAESVIKLNTIDQEDIGNTFAQNFDKEPWRGYASGPPSIFDMVKHSGLSYIEAARKLFGGSGSFGNGAAMRIVPVGIRFFDSKDLYDKAAATAEITHAHPVGKDGAAIQAIAIAEAVRIKLGRKFDIQKFLEKLIKSARTPEIRDKLNMVKNLLLNNEFPQKAAQKLGKSVAVHESMPFSLYSFLKYPTNFYECLFCAVLNGGDRDTLGAMACSISGAYLGSNSIPEAWIEKLENKDYILNLARTLYLSRISN